MKLPRKRRPIPKHTEKIHVYTGKERPKKQQREGSHQCRDGRPATTHKTKTNKLMAKMPQAYKERKTHTHTRTQDVNLHRTRRPSPTFGGKRYTSTEGKKIHTYVPTQKKSIHKKIWGQNPLPKRERRESPANTR